MYERAYVSTCEHDGSLFCDGNSQQEDISHFLCTSLSLFFGGGGGGGGFQATPLLALCAFHGWLPLASVVKVFNIH